MDDWNVLEIEATTDTKLIKRAYAKKLKVTRPDEHPEAFQALYASYKRALQYAKTHASDDVKHEQINTQDSSTLNNEAIAEGTEKTSQTTDTKSDDVASMGEYAKDNDSNITEQQIHNELSEEEKAAHSKYEEKYQALAKQCKEAIENEDKRNDINAWSFLLRSPMLLDTQVNTKLGLLVFEHIYKLQESYNQLSKHQRKYAHPNSIVQRTTLVYLDDIFSWHTQANVLQYYFGEKACQLMMTKIFEALRQRTNTQAPPKVKGGTGFTYQKPVDMGAKQDARTYAFYSLLSLNNWASGILGCLMVIFACMSIYDGRFVQAAIGLGGATVIAMQWWGLKQEKIVAYYTMWLFSCLLMLWFPVGTIYGFRLVNALYKSNGYIK